MIFSDLTENDQRVITSTFHKFFCGKDADYVPFEEMTESEKKAAIESMGKRNGFLCSRSDIRETG